MVLEGRRDDERKFVASRLNMQVSREHRCDEGELPQVFVLIDLYLLPIEVGDDDDDEDEGDDDDDDDDDDDEGDDDDDDDETYFEDKVQVNRTWSWLTMIVIGRRVGATTHNTCPHWGLQERCMASYACTGPKRRK